MDLPASSTLRWARAGLLGVVVLAAGSIAHASAGGLMPGPVALIVLGAAIIGGCATLLGREVSAARLVGMLVVGQGLVHMVLAATAGHRGEHTGLAAPGSGVTTPVTPWDPRSGESYDQWASHAFGSDGAGLVIPSWVTHVLSDVSARPAMALAHVLAAVAVGLWLSTGERALWTLVRIAANGVAQLARWVAAQLAGLPVLARSGARPRPRDERFRVDPPLLPIWSRGPVRRGPPVVMVAR